MRKGVGITVSLMVVAAAALLGGCGDTAVRRESLWNPSAAEMGPVTSKPQINNGMSHTIDTNGRLFWDDMGRFWLLDRPSHLTPYPVR